MEPILNIFFLKSSSWIKKPPQILLIFLYTNPQLLSCSMYLLSWIYYSTIAMGTLTLTQTMKLNKTLNFSHAAERQEAELLRVQTENDVACLDCFIFWWKMLCWNLQCLLDHYRSLDPIVEDYEHVQSLYFLVVNEFFPFHNDVSEVFSVFSL